jgi:hypothetical protein
MCGPRSASRTDANPGHQAQPKNALFPKRNSGAFVFIRHIRSSARSRRIIFAGSVWRVFPVGTGRRLRSGRVAFSH